MNTNDYITWLMSGLAFMSLAFLVCSILLWREKQKRSRQIISVSDQREEEGFDVPIRVASDEDEDGASAQSEPVLVNRNAVAENAIFELDHRTYTLSTQGKNEEARIAAEKALSVAVTKLTGDHWLLARLLNRLAYFELVEGEHFKALSHLEAAQAILSEWPDTSPKDEQVIASNLAYCHRALGF